MTQDQSRQSESIVSVAVAAPLIRSFHYLLPAGLSAPAGCRVLVPFGRSRRIGFIMPSAAESATPPKELKQVIEVIDSAPLFDAVLLELLCWTAAYYQHPLGEVLQAALPTRLRKRLDGPAKPVHFALTEPSGSSGVELPAQAVRQRQIIDLLDRAGAAGLSRAALRQHLGDCGDALRRLESRGLIHRVLPTETLAPLSGPGLNARQLQAVERIDAAQGSFRCLLVKGVTGSGKTEVYLECARRAIQRGRQALVLVPEIALTPQLVARFRERLGSAPAVLHSGLSEGERQHAWLDAASGKADIVLGTRLAVFAQLPRPGIIIIDEEHDASFKQQEGFRYNARDVAIKRAALHRIPVVLGSATPALESFHNAQRGRYTLLELPERAGAANMPLIRLVDTRHWPVSDGLSQPLIKAIGERLGRGEQSLVFINRRGFAPVVMCGQCGWQARCTRCDASLTLHRQARLLRCHHCGSTQPALDACPQCQGTDLYFAGVGTQRVEQALAARFPGARILRIDRDTSSGRGALEQQLDQVRRHEVDILVGTQLLSKGHDFPHITLVGVLNCDQGMYSVDFRASERLFQLVTQVSGRAGRGESPGEVLLQTRFTDHPCMAAIRQHDYESYARNELSARRALRMPPFGHLVLWRAESLESGAPQAFLARIRAMGESMGATADGDYAAVEIMDPVPAPMERRAGRFRAQLMWQSPHRAPLRKLLHALVLEIEDQRISRKVRWSVDVDPMDLY